MQTFINWIPLYCSFAGALIPSICILIERFISGFISSKLASIIWPGSKVFQQTFHEVAQGHTSIDIFKLFALSTLNNVVIYTILGLIVAAIARVSFWFVRGREQENDGFLSGVFSIIASAPAKGWPFALSIPVIVALTVFANLGSEFGPTSEEAKIFRGHHAEIWRFFCNHSAESPDSQKNFCTQRSDCMLAVAHLRKPCEPTGRYTSGFVWLKQENRSGAIVCQKMHTLISVGTAIFEEQAQGDVTQVAGPCTAEAARKLILSRTTGRVDDFFDSPPTFVGFSERAMLLYGRNGLDGVWENEVKKLEGTPSRYTEQEWRSLPPQDDHFYPGLKIYIKEYQRLQTAGQAIY